MQFPISFFVYSNDEIRLKKYKSDNTVIMKFCKTVHKQSETPAMRAFFRFSPNSIEKVTGD